jgi:hypothetical protein
MEKSYKDLYARTAEYHKRLIEELEALGRQALEPQTLEDLADLRFVTWHLERLGADIKKKLASLDRVVVQVLVLRWANSSLNGDPIRTDYATFSPSLTAVPNLPSHKNDPEKYNECLRAMGVPDEVIDTEAVKIHWPALQNYVEQLASEGKPLPSCFGSEFTQAYACRVSHKKLEVLEEPSN